MNALSRCENKWNPFKEMDDLQNRLSALFDRTFGRLPARQAGDHQETLTMAEWAPLVDITEDDKEYLIKAELPEVQKADLNVTVENRVLTITGERKTEKEEKGKKYHRLERAYGRFERSFTVPDDADAAKVNAEFKDGVLLVHIAKNEIAKPKTIEVKIG